MKKLLALLLIFLMLVTTVVGCNETAKKATSSEPTSSEEVADVEEEEYYEEEYVEEEEYYEDDYTDYGDDLGDYELPEDEEEETGPLTPEEKRLEAMLLGNDAELNKDAIYNVGNLTRMAKAVKKSKGGKNVNIVFYGNGVNTGHTSSAAMADTSYANLFSDWWSANIGPCTVVESGLENLTSTSACMRVDVDVLRHKPDIVFLDFSVQDAILGLANSNAIAYDNLVRRILQSTTAPAVVTLLLTGAEQTTYTMNPKNANMFTSAAKQHKQVSKYYDIPVIDFEESVWENFTELVKVTTKKEIPLITWESISLSNVSMNSDGHSILAGTIKYFVENNVVKKLNKISTTKDHKYPTEGYFGIDKYMKGSFITVGDIVEKNGSARKKGYTFDLNDSSALKANGYTYEARSASDTSSLRPNISAYRHYIAADASEAEQSVEENPHYLTLNMPKVTNSETYFMVYSTANVSTSHISNKNILDFAPMSFYCYDENGDLLSRVKAPFSNYSETTTLGKTSAVKIPIGTTKIEFRLYTRSGTIRLLGLSEFK